jgi:type I site-specific restriction endonuclease
MHTDNIRWEGLKDLCGNKLTPKQINRALFITEWDDAVISELQKTWGEVYNPKAIVFCGTIDHAMMVCNRINARGFCKADAIFSGEYMGRKMTQHERNLLLCDFQQGDVNVICAVDIFNEGLDVPDVNIVVFNRVTHSRRIFIQQLGRGLRIAEGKKSTVVLDFAQDIRRLAAGIKMKDGIMRPQKGGVTVSIGNKVTFKRIGGEDLKAEAFLRAWIEDVEMLEGAGDDVGVLKFPPEIE